MPPKQSSSFVNPRKVSELKEAFTFSKPLILIYGPSGCGKRHSATLIAAEIGLRLLDLSEFFTSTGDLVSQLTRLTFLSSNVIGTFDGRSLRPSEAQAISDFLARRPNFRLIIFAESESELVRILPSQTTAAVHFRPVTDLNIRKFLKLKLPQISDHQIEALVLEASGDLRAATNLVTLHAPCRKRKFQEEISDHKSEISFFHAVGRALYRKPETFNVNTMLEIPSVVGNFMFLNFMHENAVDFLSDVEGLAYFWKFLAFSDLFRDDELKLCLTLHAWQATPNHCHPGGFRELRKPRKSEIRGISDHILRYTRPDDHRMSVREKRDRLFAAHALLEATHGNFFSRVPGFVLSGIHAAANWRPDVSGYSGPPARVQQPLDDDIVEVEW